MPPRALESLSQATFAPHLRRLNLMQFSGLDDQGLVALAGGEFAALRCLELGGHRFTAEGMRALARAPWFANLEYLDLGRCGLGDDGIVALARSGGSSELRTLFVEHNAIGDRGVVAIAESERWPHLETLHLRRNGIADAGAVALARTRLPLAFVDLCSNAVGDVGGFALAASTIPSLRHVDLMGNPIESAEEALDKAPFSVSLRA